MKDRTEVRDIIEYWQTLEFLSQDIYQSNKGLVRLGKRKQADDFLIIKGADVLEKTYTELIEEKVRNLSCREWSSIQVSIGEIRRSICIEKIAMLMKLEDEDVPERETSRISLATIQLTAKGEYVKGSLSLSPILYSLHELEENGGLHQSAFHRKRYGEQVKNLEEMFFPDEEIPEYEEEEGKFSPYAVSMELLQKLYAEIQSTYLKTVEGYEESYSFGYRVYKDRKKEEEDDFEYKRLDRHFYSSDLEMILRELPAMNDETFERLEEYVTALNWDYSADRVDLLNPPESMDDAAYAERLREYVDVSCAPLGKWPSRYSPAFMQQVAINCITGMIGTGQNIFSVNGPPGTGKTTMIKEVVANNIVERAKLLAQYEKPDDAFCQEHLHQAASPYLGSWYRIKDDHINDYSILVASNNNVAVENISKELPQSVTGNLQPSSGDSNALAEALEEVSSLFAACTDISEERKKEQVKEGIYFASCAADLTGKPDAWGIPAAPLGKKQNIKSFYMNVIAPITRAMGKNVDIERELSTYQEVREAFLKQLSVVLQWKERLKESSDLQHQIVKDALEIESMEKDAEEFYGRWKEFRKGIFEDLRARAEDFEAYDPESSSFMRNCLSSNDFLHSMEEIKGYLAIRRKQYQKQKEDAEHSIGFFSSLSHSLFGKETEEYASHMHQAKEYAACSERVNLLQEFLAQALEEDQEAGRGYERIRTLFNQKLSQFEWKKERLAEMEREEVPGYDGYVLLDGEFAGELRSSNIQVSTEAHVKNPGVSQRYDREREKLFGMALMLNKEFILSSKHCRTNLNLLSEYWGFSTSKDRKAFVFHEKDKEAMLPSIFQTMFLLVPVISTTFASVGRMFQDVKRPGFIGMLMVDEAGQAEPYTALGAMYRCRKMVAVGDQKQIAPVVTEDLRLLRRAYGDETLDYYRDESLSIQTFADSLNSVGTVFSDGGEDLWAGCPLVVHRRCISPMFDISNSISYDGIMKKKTMMPKAEKEENFILERSCWIDVKGKEKGNKNHFVEAQAEKVCELLKSSFEKNENPDVFIISPFTTVEDGIKKYIMSHCEDRIKAYFGQSKRIGTIHTFQGKEAEEVFFVLGCDDSPKSSGAIGWLGTNIVNVAASRAKYRLYIIGDSECWKESEPVSRAKAIMDAWTIQEIKEISERNLPVEEKAQALVDLSNHLPAGASYVKKEGEDDSIDTDFLSEKLSDVFKDCTIDSDEWESLGISKEYLESLPKDVGMNLSLGVNLFLMLKPIYALNQDLDASCCGILFCKAMENQLHACFEDSLKQAFPEFLLNATGKKDNQPLKNAKSHQLTIGSFGYIIKENLLEIIGRTDGSYDNVWWTSFYERLDKCRILRNHCCHSSKFGWEDQEKLMELLFGLKKETANEGLVRDSEAGKLL